jgi:hypothetical protein
MNVYFFSNHPALYFDTDADKIVAPESRNLIGSRQVTIGKFLFLRFLKNKYSNKPRFETNFIAEVKRAFDTKMPESLDALLSFFQENYDMVDPYSYKEAFECEWDFWRSIVFGSIRVSEMIKELGHERIAVAGQPVRHKQFSKSGEFLGYREYDVVFETHRVNGEKLGIRGNIYAVKCWCTTTNNEHWLWINDEYRNDPLEAIARTFFIHANLIPHIKELKRQGDILLVELNSDIEPRGQIVSLNKDQYFNLLTAQS